MKELALYLRSTAVYRSAALLSAISLILLMVLMYWLPLHMEVEGMERTLPDNKTEIAKLKKEIEVRKLLVRNNSAIKRIEGRLRTKADQESIVRRLASLARRAGVAVREHTFSGTEVEGGVLAVNQSLIITGKYTALREFIALLNTDMPGLTVISRVNISNKTPDALSAHIDMQSYSMVTE